MQLEHQFSVPAPIDVVWKALLDPELVAPCMPGATLSRVEGSEFDGSVKVKLGPVNLTYKGSGQFVETDEQDRKAVLKASGKDVRGNSTASATVSVELRPDGSGTTAAVTTDLSITGRPAQLGRGMMTEVGGKILNTFASNLAARLAPEPVAADTAAESATAQPTGTEPADGAQTDGAQTDGAQTDGAQTDGAQIDGAVPATGPTAAPQVQPLPQQPAAEPEALDLLGTAAGPVLKRVLPVVGVIALAVILYVVLRNRR
jgi:carbon monoxide dehydrogenase subunit G